MTGATLVALAVAVAGGLLAPSLVLDILSLWPLAAFGVVVGAVGWMASGRWDRRTAVLPMVLLSWVGVSLGLHLAEWDRLPSSAADLVGPAAANVVSVGLEISASELLVIGPGERALYDIRPLRRGGGTGVPVAIETLSAENPSIDVIESAADWWFTSAGWRVALDGRPIWSLDVTSRRVDADLAMVDLRRLTMEADGVVLLPAVDRVVAVQLDGDLHVRVPPGVAVEILGEADVPPSWQRIDGGWTSSAGGPGYEMAIAPGSRVTIVEG